MYVNEVKLKTEIHFLPSQHRVGLATRFKYVNNTLFIY